MSRSNWPGGASQAEAREVHAREEQRQEAAARAEREGWGQEPVTAGPVARMVAHSPADPFCECDECRTR
jgi:hypothetical protein